MISQSPRPLLSGIKAGIRFRRLETEQNIRGFTGSFDDLKQNFIQKLSPDIWGFPEIGVPQNGWFIRENPIKLDDLGVPLF